MSPCAASLLAGALLLALAAPASSQGRRAPVTPTRAYPWVVVPVDAIRGHLMEGRFREPAGVHFDVGPRELFVADGKNGLIGIFDEEGIPLFAFGGPRLLHDPKAVRTTADGSIWVLEAYASEIRAFSYRGEPEGAFGFRYPATDDRPAGTARIGTFTIDHEGRFYVADWDEPQLLAYDADLSFRFAIRPEPAAARFQLITGIAVSKEGLIAVVDFRATPVQIFDPDGRFLRGFGEREIAREDFTSPVSVTFDEDGFLYIADMLRHDVKIYDADGAFAGVFGGWFSPESGGAAPGEMLYPSSVAVAPGGLLYVAERFGNRVQIFERITRQELERRLAAQADARRAPVADEAASGEPAGETAPGAEGER